MRRALATALKPPTALLLIAIDGVAPKFASKSGGSLKEQWIYNAREISCAKSVAYAPDQRK
jgi:hypothetical protein